VLLPCQQAKLARDAKDKEPAMSQTPNTAIALANKLARIAWAVLAEGRAFELTRTDDAGVVRPA
jgi:hypothetical protein